MTPSPDAEPDADLLTAVGLGLARWLCGIGGGMVLGILAGLALVWHGVF